MQKFFLDITQWPSGIGVGIENEKGESYGFAGACGGGVGHTIQRFTISGARLEKLKEILNG